MMFQMMLLALNFPIHLIYLKILQLQFSFQYYYLAMIFLLVIQNMEIFLNDHKYQVLIP